MHLVAQVFLASLLEFTFLPFYFDLSFTVLSFLFPFLHFELPTELDNLIAMQNLRTSANKGSNDAYDVSVSLTLPSCLPNTQRPFSESAGSVSACEPVVFSESHDVNDVQLQVALADPNGPRAPLRPKPDVGDMCTLGCVGSSASDEEAVPHNIWKSLLSAMVHFRIGDALQPLLTEEEMGKAALTCRFVCDALCAELYDWDGAECG